MGDSSRKKTLQTRGLRREFLDRGVGANALGAEAGICDSMEKGTSKTAPSKPEGAAPKRRVGGSIGGVGAVGAYQSGDQNGEVEDAQDGFEDGNGACLIGDWCDARRAEGGHGA